MFLFLGLAARFGTATPHVTSVGLFFQICFALDTSMLFIQRMHSSIGILRVFDLGTDLRSVLGSIMRQAKWKPIHVLYWRKDEEWVTLGLCPLDISRYWISEQSIEASQLTWHVYALILDTISSEETDARNTLRQGGEGSCRTPHFRALSWTN